MSSALLKKSLELAESEYTHKVFGKGETSLYSQIKILNKSTKHKELRGISDIKRRSLKTVEKVKRKVKDKNNRIKENLKKLEVLHKLSVDDKIIQVILEDSNTFSAEEQATVEEQKSAFTEKDFIDFEKEYFGN